MTSNSKDEPVTKPDKAKTGDDKQATVEHSDTAVPEQPETPIQTTARAEAANNPGNQIPAGPSDEAISRYTGVIARWTRILVVVTLAYAVIAAYQTCQVKRSVDATRDIVGQNERMINTANQQANAASDQVNAMRGQLNAMQDQAKTMKAQTNTMDQSLAETRKSVNTAERQVASSQASVKAA